MSANLAQCTAPARTIPDSASILIRAQAFVDRKYTTRADARQQEMGLAYVEAERQDLAREIARFVLSEIAALPRDVELLDAADFDGLAIDKQPTGFTASILLGLVEGGGNWSPREFAASPSEAVAKCLKKHAAKVPTVPLAPVLAPPPY